MLPEAIDGSYCEYIFEHLFRAGYRALCIENIELYRDAIDVVVLKVLSSLVNPHLKIVFEVGTLDAIDHRLQHIVEGQGHREIFKLTRLDKDKAMGLHRFLHGAEPPPDLFKRTNGLPLAIEHQAAINPDDSSLGWVEKKLQSLDKDCRKLAYVLSNLEEPCLASDLERIYAATDFYSTLLSLLDANICEEDTFGVKFKHPSFRLALRRRPSPSLDRQILSKTLDHKEALSDDLHRILPFHGRGRAEAGGPKGGNRSCPEGFSHRLSSSKRIGDTLFL